MNRERPTNLGFPLISTFLNRVSTLVMVRGMTKNILSTLSTTSLLLSSIMSFLLMPISIIFTESVGDKISISAFALNNNSSMELSKFFSPTSLLKKLD